MISTYWNGASRFAGALPAASTMKAWPSVAAMPIPITQPVSCHVSADIMAPGIDSRLPASTITPSAAIAATLPRNCI